MRKLLWLVALMAMPAMAQAQQDAYVELLRSDVKTQRVAIITEVMQFSDSASAIFWPIYRDYEFESTKIGDDMLALIKDYAANYDSLSEEMAKDLAKRALKIDEDRLKLRKKYFKRVEKELGSVTAAKFLQIENQIGLLIDLQIAQSLPLIQ
jgi:NurA-like 5'-3' nuclease